LSEPLLSRLINGRLQLHQSFHNAPPLLKQGCNRRLIRRGQRYGAFSTTTSSWTATFESLEPPLHPASNHALTHKLKLTTPTDIQIKSYEAAITGRDVLARARTGTGKTLAFLLPAIQNALANIQTSSKSKVEILVLCPTRELASQIHSTSQVLAASHSNSNDSTRMNTQVMFGGVSKENDLQKLNQKLPFILVATPGRLLDHMENSVVRGVKFGEILGGVSVLVLDEVSPRYIQDIMELLGLFDSDLIQLRRQIDAWTWDSQKICNELSK
jgi:superfamily II DNA/RNA helicase